jgi:HSP20 family protein
MHLSVFEPSNGLSLREAMNRLLEDSFVRNERGHLNMQVDVLDTPEAILVQASLPGVSKDQIEINFEKDILTIKAELRAPENPPEGTRVLLRERHSGSVSRTFRLPMPVDAEAASAEFQDGILSLKLPKKDSARPRQIPIN